MLILTFSIQGVSHLNKGRTGLDSSLPNPVLFPLQEPESLSESVVGIIQVTERAPRSICKQEAL